MSSMYMLIFLCVCVGFGAWLLFLWAVKSGQFDDVEGPKYRMLDDDDKEPQKKSVPPENKNSKILN